jgi:hypothetical protein
MEELVEVSEETDTPSKELSDFILGIECGACNQRKDGLGLGPVHFS